MNEQGRRSTVLGVPRGRQFPGSGAVAITVLLVFFFTIVLSAVLRRVLPDDPPIATATGSGMALALGTALPYRLSSLTTGKTLLALAAGFLLAGAVVGPIAWWLLEVLRVNTSVAVGICAGVAVLVANLVANRLDTLPRRGSQV
jgi:hypothetical protein